ncbi:hypothetical protein BC829DRAFT_210480 [Chytridium lagenaria]|nr:hypothetical protein BC829DRAFT_210480 [Chytridium lagenaria]
MEVIQLVLEDLSIQTLCQSAMTSKIDDLIRLRDAGKKEPLGKPIAVPTNRPKTSHGRHLHTESVKPAATTDSSTEAMEMDPFQCLNDGWKQPVERRFGSFAELEVSFVSVTDGPTFEDGCVIKMQRKLVLVVVETVEEFRSEKFELKLARHEESKMEVLLVYPTDDVVRGRARVPACRIGAPLGKIF